MQSLPSDTVPAWTRSKASLSRSSPCSPARSSRGRSSARWATGGRDSPTASTGSWVSRGSCHAVLAYPEYLFWKTYLHVPDADGQGFHNVFTDGSGIGWWVALIPVLYVGTPVLLGFLASRSARENGLLGRILVGRNPAPRAWDELFWRGPALVVRMKLKDGEWVGGLFGDNSYASGYPEPQDLLLEETYEILDDGTFVPGDDPEDFVPLGSSMLISWSEVQFLEAFDFTA
jgi:hypothetical protein